MKTLKLLTIVIFSFTLINCGDDDNNPVMMGNFPNSITLFDDEIRYSYNNNNQISQINFVDGDYIADLSYNSSGNLVEWREQSGPEVIQFTYDSNEHLNSMTISGVGVDIDGEHTIDRSSNNDYAININGAEFILELDENNNSERFRYDNGAVVSYVFNYDNSSNGVFQNVVPQPALLMITNLFAPAFSQYFLSTQNINSVDSGLLLNFDVIEQNSENFPTRIVIENPSGLNTMEIEYETRAL